MRSPQYERPSEIPADMGGARGALDPRLRGVVELMSQAALAPGARLLDVGAGSGQLAIWLAKKGFAVCATGLEIGSYDLDAEECRRYGIELYACSADHMPFADGSFDAVVMSHVLEHCPNVRLALDEVRRVLRPGGTLLVFVPPHGPHVSAGHVSMGWSVGQLMYALVLAGFSVRRGRFIQWLGNVCAFVEKDAICLPPMRGDRGDLNILSKAGCFPVPINSSDGFNDGFWGNIGAINWDRNHIKHLHGIRTLREFGFSVALAGVARRLIPRPLRPTLSRSLMRFSQFLAETHVNPTELRG